MEDKSRRGLLTKGAVAAVAAAGAAMMGQGSEAQAQPRLEKRSPYPPNPSGTRPMFSRAVAYGNMLFISGVGAHYFGTIEEHTKTVLDEISKNLTEAGSSLQKCL